MFLIYYFAIFDVFISGSCRVTLLVVFDFLSQNFGWAVANGTVAGYKCRLSDEDTLNFFHSKAIKMLKHFPHITKTINFVRQKNKDTKMTYPSTVI